jgi:hypothetical protein
MRGGTYLQLCACGLSAAVLVAAPGAKAEDAGHDVCQTVGNHARMPLGDRQGHALETDTVSCRPDAGPLAGGVVTVASFWEWDGTKATMLSGQGYVHMPNGDVSAFKGVDGQIELTMADGKVTRVTASGHNVATMTTGALASVGKTVSWTLKATGPDTFEIDETFK